MKAQCLCQNPVLSPDLPQFELRDTALRRRWRAAHDLRPRPHLGGMPLLFLKGLSARTRTRQRVFHEGCLATCGRGRSFSHPRSGRFGRGSGPVFKTGLGRLPPSHQPSPGRRPHSVSGATRTVAKKLVTPSFTGAAYRQHPGEPIAYGTPQGCVAGEARTHAPEEDDPLCRR